MKRLAHQSFSPNTSGVIVLGCSSKVRLRQSLICWFAILLPFLISCDDDSDPEYRGFGAKKSGPSSTADVARERERKAAEEKKQEAADPNAIVLPNLREAVFVAP